MDITGAVAAWDAGEWVTVPRLTRESPSTEQAAHVLAFELLRDQYGLPLPESSVGWESWGAETVQRVLSWPDMGDCLLPEHISAAKGWVIQAMNAGWQAALPTDDLQLQRVSQRWPHRLLAEPQADDQPTIIKGEAAGASFLALQTLVLELSDRITALEKVRPSRAFKLQLEKALAAQEQLAADMKGTLTPLIEEALEELLAPVEQKLDALTARLLAVEALTTHGPKPQPVPAGPTAVLGRVRPVQPAAAPPANAAPVVVTTPAGGHPQKVIEGSRPLEHGLRGDEPRPKAPVRTSE